MPFFSSRKFFPFIIALRIRRRLSPKHHTLFYAAHFLLPFYTFIGRRSRIFPPNISHKMNAPRILIESTFSMMAILLLNLHIFFPSVYIYILSAPMFYRSASDSCIHSTFYTIEFTHTCTGVVVIRWQPFFAISPS